MAVLFGVTVLASTISVTSDAILLSDLSQSFSQSLSANHSPRIGSNASFYSPLLDLSQVNFSSHQRLAALEHVRNRLNFCYLVMLATPEVHRFLTCIYFIQFRHIKSWRVRSIIFITVIELLDAVLLALFLFTCAHHVMALQLVSLGFISALPLSIFQLLACSRLWHDPKSINGKQKCVLNVLGSLLQGAAFSIFLWSLVYRQVSPRIVSVLALYLLTSTFKHLLNFSDTVLLPRIRYFIT